MDKPSMVCVCYMEASPDEVWNLLMDSSASPTWFFGHRMEVGDAIGDGFRVIAPDGSVEVDGTILVRDASRRLRVRWFMPDMPLLPDDDEVEFVIEDKGNGVVRLAIVEFRHPTIPEKWIEAGREAWSVILSGIKTILETGRPLPLIEMKPPE